MEAYPIDLRMRVLQAVDEGVDTLQEITDTFGVTTRWIRLLVQRRREIGSIEPSPRAGGWEPKFTPKRLERFKTFVELRPYATLNELRKSSRVHRCNLSVSRALKQMGFTRKKDATC